MVEEEKKKHAKVDEMKKTLNATRLDINDSRRILTTDHDGHPLLIRHESPDKLPVMISKTKVKLNSVAILEGSAAANEKE
jgi:hypothetical protein